MKRKIYLLLSSAKHGLFALALVVSGALHSQQSFTFAFTGAVQTLTLPPGNWRIQCWGADGGDVTLGPLGGGKGGYSVGDYNITTPGTLLNILVGGKGVSAQGINGPSGSGGWNGGGGGGFCGRSAGGGGGATDVRVGGLTAANRVIVSGGGGGAAYYNQLAAGGHGGGQMGQSGNIITSGNVLTPGGGGAGANGNLPGLSPNAFMSTNGTANGGGGGGNSPTGFGLPGIGGGQGGAGGTTAGGATGGSGGGGGGYAGGAGGTQTVNVGAGGGGGSSFIGGVTNGTTTMIGQPGFVSNPDNAGNGRVIITELCSISIYASGSNSLFPAICSGQSLTLTTNAISNYSWSTGQTTNSIVVAPTTNTVYNLSGTGTLICSAATSMSVIVNPGLPVISITNPSTSICLGSTVSLTATGALSYTWTNPGVVNGQTFTPNSTAVYTVTGQNGCGTTVSTTTINVAPLPVSTVANPTMVCEGYPALLSSTASVNGFTWQPGAQTGSVITVAPMVNTVYTVTASDGICSGTQTVLVTTKTTPTIATSQTLSNICAGQSVTLSASGAGTGGTYSWTPGGAGSSIVLSPSTSTAVVVAGTNSLNCTSTAQQIILVGQPPAVVVSANKLAVCSGDPVVLTASGAPIYQWTNGPSTANFTVNPTTSSVYTVTGSQTTNSCTINATIAINAVVSNVNITSALSVCDGGSVAIVATGASTYKWNGGINSPNGTYIATPVSTSIFTLVATTSSFNVNCLTTLFSTVTVNPKPTLTVTPVKETICRGQTHTLTATGAVNYTWTSPSNTGSVITVKPNTTTIYIVTGVDANGCENTLQYTAKVSPCTGIEEATKQQELTIFPNPNNGQFFVSSDKALTLNLTNALGQTIQTIELNAENGFKFEVSGLAKGVYYLSSAIGQNQSDYTKVIVN